MNDTLNKFFELLRSGLWGTEPAIPLFENKTDWNKIYEISRQQALLAIVLDAINKLPENLKPSRGLYIKWCADVLQIEDENHRLDREVVSLFTMLEDNGVNPILMKGQGISRNYIIPDHRSCGDIDIYIGKKNYDKVNDLLSIEGKALEKWSPKHIMYEWHDVIVENHRIMAKLNSPISNRKLQEIINDWHFNNNTDTIEIENKEIKMPPLEFNVVYLLLHSVVHLMTLGIGLRQTCDWAMLLHKKRNLINKEEVKSILKELGLTQPAKVFGALAVNYLGMPQEDLIIPFSNKDKEHSKFLLEDILYNGNFGFSGERIKQRPKGFLKRKIYNLYNTTRRANKLKNIAPREALWAPYKRFENFFKHKKDTLLH